MNPASPQPVGQKQAELNSSTRGQWAIFDSHRQQIERLLITTIQGRSEKLLLPHTRRKPRLGVLGAGNCNDLDLNWLASHFGAIHLLDLDAAALDRAVQRQRAAGLPMVHRIAPVDLTGIATHLDQWLERPPTPEQVQDAIRAAASCPAPSIPEPLDVLLSPCLLSQLIAPARDRLGTTHLLLPALRGAIIRRHLQLLIEMLAPGGTALFITDVVSSDTVRDLPRVPPAELSGLLQNLVAMKKTFRGLDPAAISSILDENPAIARQIVSRQWSAPWLWHLSPMRTYLVYALRLNKRMA